MFLKNIEDAFLTLLNDYFTIPVILDYQGKPEPKGDYGVVGLTVHNKAYRDENHSYKTQSGFKESVKQTFEVTLTVRFYGDSCYDNAFKSQAYLNMRSTQEILKTDYCISSVDISSIRRIPEKRDTGYVQKSSYDAVFYVAYQQEQDVDWFDTVSYQGDYKDLGGATVLHDQQTISINHSPLIYGS